MRYPTPYEILNAISTTHKRFHWEGWELVSIGPWGEIDINTHYIRYWKDNVLAGMTVRIERGKGEAPWIASDKGNFAVALNTPRPDPRLDEPYGEGTGSILDFMRTYPDSVLSFIDNEMDWEDEAHVFGYIASTEQGVALAYLPYRPIGDHEAYEPDTVITDTDKMYSITLDEGSTITRRL